MHKYIAHDIINLKRHIFANGFNNYSFIYRNTNENIQGYLSKIKVKDKDILTVASSGDHALLSLLNNAKSVETYDINYLAKFYQELKLSAYQVLSYEDFIKFFYENKGFTYEIFEKIYNLEEDIDDFWQFLFDYNDDYSIIDSPLFSNFEYGFNTLKNFHPFLDKDYFNNHKTIHNLTFYHSDILNLPTTLKKKYDIIILSSIPNFISRFKRLDYFKKYLKQLSNNLNKDGLIIANYLYNVNNPENSIFKDDNLLFKTFNKKELEKLTFPSLDQGITDGVLIYKK